MHRPRLIDPCPDFRRQIVVCRRHIGPHRVAADGRHLAQLQHRAHRRAFPERHIRVPYILERRDRVGRLVEAHHVLRITARQQRIGLQLTPIPGEFPLCAGAQPLPAEEQHLPLQQCPVQLRPQLPGQRPGQVQPTDFGPDGGRLRYDLEALVGPLVPSVGGSAQQAGAFVQAVGGDAVGAQGGRAGGRSGGCGIGKGRQLILLEGKGEGRAGQRACEAREGGVAGAPAGPGAGSPAAGHQLTEPSGRTGTAGRGDPTRPRRRRKLRPRGAHSPWGPRSRGSASRTSRCVLMPRTVPPQPGVLNASVIDPTALHPRDDVPLQQQEHHHQRGDRNRRATNSSCRLRFCAVVNVDRATCTVHASWSCPITSGHRNAFQAPMKTIVPTAAKTGRALGTTMRQYVRQ